MIEYLVWQRPHGTEVRMVMSDDALEADGHLFIMSGGHLFNQIAERLKPGVYDEEGHYLQPFAGE